MSVSGFSPEGSNLSSQVSIKSQDTGNSSVITEKGNEVSVAWRKFAPKKEAADLKDKAVIFFTGSVMQSNAVSVEDLPQSFADASGTQAIAIDTSPKRPQPDYQDEMEVVVRLLVESGVKDVTLAGHSNGAIKALELALLLKKLRGTPQEIKVNGLVLIDSTHLYNQNPAALVGNFAKVSAQEMIQEEPNKASKAAGPDFFKALRERVGYSGSVKDYAKVLFSQVKDMAKLNPRLSGLDVPVVVFTSDKNPVASYKKVAPIVESPIRPFKTTNAQKQTMTLEQLKQRRQAVASNMENRVENRHKREQFLRENRFTSAPGIRVIVPKGYHNTLPTHRFEGTAKAGLYYLNQLPSQRQKAA